MSQHFFGVGDGRLTKTEIRRREQIARTHHAEFIYMHPESCKCGHGHDPFECPVLHYWFACANMGEPFDSATARAVMAEI